MACALATGCAPTYGWRTHSACRSCGRGADGAASLIAAVIFGVEISRADAPTSAEEGEPPPEGVETPAYRPYVPPPPPRVTAPDPEHVRFDTSAAIAALHAVDLSTCVERGAPRGYGHARLTFAANGAASVVAIDTPPGMSKDAVACLGERFGQLAAPPFDGAPITVGASFYVR